MAKDHHADYSGASVRERFKDRNSSPPYYSLLIVLSEGCFMPSKQQFWDYIVTVEIKVSAADREEAKQIIIKELSASHILPNETVTIVRVKPIIKK